MTTINFKYAGTLFEFKAYNCCVAGVYMFIYKQTKHPDRIIYVGESKNIAERICEHTYNMKHGAFTLWKPGVKDIYELMTIENENYNDEDLMIKYKDSQKNKDVWMPGLKMNDYYCHLFDSNLIFNPDEWLSNEYIHNIHILMCEHEDRRKLLESSIQASMCNYDDGRRIAYYRKINNQSWLGKQMKSVDDIKNYYKENQFEFSDNIDFPNVIIELNNAINKFFGKS